MSLILLQPGGPDFFQGFEGTWQNDGSALANAVNAQMGQGARAVELLSATSGMSIPLQPPGAGGRRAAAYPDYADVTAMKNVDRTTPTLYDFCARTVPLGQGHDQPTRIYIATAGAGNAVTVFAMALRDALVSTIATRAGGASSDAPTDVFTLTFTEVIWSTTTPTGRFMSGWSRLRNGPIGEFTE